MLTCDQALELISARLDDMITPEESAALEEHLVRCPDCRALLADFEAMTTKLIGKKTALFRPPYGEYNDTVITTVRGLGYEVIQWDIDTVDTEWMTGS